MQQQRQRTESPEGPALANLVETQLRRMREDEGGRGEDSNSNSSGGASASNELHPEVSPVMVCEGCEDVDDIFDAQCLKLDHMASEQRKRYQLKALIHQEEGETAGSLECVSFERLSTDKFTGDARLRTVRGLLAEIDKRGFERSNHQIRFHEAFMRACSRVYYKEEWSVHKSMIMRQNGWTTTPSEVMISTPYVA